MNIKNIYRAISGWKLTCIFGAGTTKNENTGARSQNNYDIVFLQYSVF